MSTQQENRVQQEATKTHLFTRQPRSTLGRIAFWTFLVGAIASLGGAVAITIGSGAPSRDIVVATTCGLVCTILVATRVRWLQVMAMLIGGYLLYLVITEPFVVESLTNPKGPHGGLGAFVGEMLVVANAMIAFIATVGTVVQDYSGGSRKAPRWLPSALGCVLGLVIGACFVGALSQPTIAPALAYTNGVPTLHVSAGNFDLPSVTIAKGSKLLLVDDTTSQHVLANGTWQQNTPIQTREPGAPLVSNLTLSGNSVTIGPFATAGTYHILCLIHHGMNLTIIVQ